MSRTYDVVVWGSTGFTGKLACEYIGKNYPNLKWALAGRKKSALEDIKKSLNLKETVGIVVADLADTPSVLAMASSTTVLLSAAGPYAKIGTPIVQACVEAGTHYCDLAGEGPWIREMIDRYSADAEKKKLRIVNCCGFDCIPCDLGNQMIVDELQKKGATVKEVNFCAYDFKGSASGGTLHSMMNMFESCSFPALLALLNPYYLNPIPEGKKKPITPTTDRAILRKAKDKMVFSYDRINQCWTIPYIMQSVDTRLVNRSNALQGFKYGEKFVFTEGLRVPNVFYAVLSVFMMPIFLLFFLNPIGRSILRCVLPAPGQGPSQHLLDHGYMKMKLWGKGTDAAGQEVVVRGTVTALNGDPGYRQTGKMMAEAAICLALDQKKLPPLYGLLTPSSAMGAVLRERLNEKGVNFHVVPDGTK